MLPLSMAQFFIHPIAPPLRIGLGCSVYTTIFDKSGSSSGDGSAVDDCGKGGRGVSNNERKAGAYLSSVLTQSSYKESLTRTNH